ncbi:hypothetical protein VTK73DRAFT_2593 [Phialemonium thermophilum]|uniref:Secreted protein n=1 Tax=Phialemonium thermophilum TaxID=223376 RepID=A0ABR3VRX1_9PEZI
MTVLCVSVFLCFRVSVFLLLLPRPSGPLLVLPLRFCSVLGQSCRRLSSAGIEPWNRGAMGRCRTSLWSGTARLQSNRAQTRRKSPRGLVAGRRRDTFACCCCENPTLVLRHPHR